MRLGDIGRRVPPRTVKGQDIELRAADGQRVDTKAQQPFLRGGRPEGVTDAMVNSLRRLGKRR
jgi:hypothetical protein